MLASTTSAATTHVRRRVGVGGETDPLDTVVPDAGCSISTAGELPDRRVRLHLLAKRLQVEQQVLPSDTAAPGPSAAPS
jgi:hypothetical protein